MNLWFNTKGDCFQIKLILFFLYLFNLGWTSLLSTTYFFNFVSFNILRRSRFGKFLQESRQKSGKSISFLFDSLLLSFVDRITFTSLFSLVHPFVGLGQLFLYQLYESSRIHKFSKSLGLTIRKDLPDFWWPVETETWFLDLIETITFGREILQHCFISLYTWTLPLVILYILIAVIYEFVGSWLLSLYSIYKVFRASWLLQKSPSRMNYGHNSTRLSPRLYDKGWDYFIVDECAASR